jgi:hypothetical protein
MTFLEQRTCLLSKKAIYTCIQTKKNIDGERIMQNKVSCCTPFVILRLCLRVWRGGKGMVLKKGKKQVEGIEKFGREGV